MKKLLLVAVLACASCDALPGELVYIKNNTNPNEKVTLSTTFKFPEKRIHNLLDTMMIINDNKDSEAMGRAAAHDIDMFFENCKYKPTGINLLYTKVQTNTDYSMTETDPTKPAFYTFFVNIFFNSGDIAEATYFKQESGSDQFYYMVKEHNPDTKIVEYKFHAMVNTTNISTERLANLAGDKPNDAPPCLMR